MGVYNSGGVYGSEVGVKFRSLQRGEGEVEKAQKRCWGAERVFFASVEICFLLYRDVFSIVRFHSTNIFFLVLEVFIFHLDNYCSFVSRCVFLLSRELFPSIRDVSFFYSDGYFHVFRKVVFL